MNCKVFISFISLFIYSLTAFSIDKSDIPEESFLLQSASSDINSFGINVYKHLAKDNNDNIFFSPYSISNAMSMAFAGSSGKTKEEMLSALSLIHNVINQYKIPDEAHHYPHSVLRKQLSTIEGLSIANKLFIQKDYDLMDKFVSKITKYYDGALEEIDFGDSKKSSELINSWVSNKTQNKIKQIVSEEMVHESILAIINAIHFKGKWKHVFHKENTFSDRFFKEENSEIIASMMEKEGNFNFYQDEKIQAIELPYTNGTSMVIFLPQEINGLEEFEKNLNLLEMKTYLSKMRKKKVIVNIPKFEISSSYNNMKSYLEKMGIESAFNNSADFSEINGEKNLLISKVIHKANIEVDENGSEASAATVVIMVNKCLNMELKFTPILFLANHPFLFLIKDNSTDSILFMGRCLNPLKKGQK